MVCFFEWAIIAAWGFMHMLSWAWMGLGSYTLTPDAVSDWGWPYCFQLRHCPFVGGYIHCDTVTYFIIVQSISIPRLTTFASAGNAKINHFQSRRPSWQLWTSRSWLSKAHSQHMLTERSSFLLYCWPPFWSTSPVHHTVQSTPLGHLSIQLNADIPRSPIQWIHPQTYQFRGKSSL